MLGNIVGCALGGVGGALFALYYTKVYPLMGGTIGMKAFSSAILGGLKKILCVKENILALNEIGLSVD